MTAKVPGHRIRLPITRLAPELLRRASKNAGAGGLIDLYEVAKEMMAESRNPEWVFDLFIDAAECDCINGLLAVAPGGNYQFIVRQVA